jgi:ribulose-bisphosphate carboxylase large chain
VLQAPGTFTGLGSTDLIVTAGGGIMAHPGGPASGVAALREAWQAAVAGVPLAERAQTHKALAQAMAAAS